MEPSPALLSRVLDETLLASARRDWRGHDKHDGLNSPLVWAVAGWSRPTRLLALQGMMRFPINLRSVLRVPEVSNPKGLALFVQALLNAWRYDGLADRLSSAAQLVDRLSALRSSAGGGCGWGYQYPWQDLGFFAPRGTPNAVVTSFVCEALLDYHAATGSEPALAQVAEALPFLQHALPRLVDTAHHLCLGYMPVPMRMRVMDVSILVGSVFARYEQLRPGAGLANDAARLVRYVVDQQTPEGAWWYTDPPGASPVRIDNYHTGFILDALWRYMQATGDSMHGSTYQKGLTFYAGQLFETDGAPRWMSDQKFPHDVHGSAQGIITFARHRVDYPGLADRIASWVLSHLYDGRGHFGYRVTRWGTDRRFYLRWNNGWMARALSDLLASSAVVNAIEANPPTRSNVDA